MARSLREFRSSSTIAVPEKGKEENKTMWPGFQAVFGVPWPKKPFATCTIDGNELSRRIRIEDRHEAISEAVKIYADVLRKYLREEEPRPQLWFAVVPEEVFKYGRPKSFVPRNQREKSSVVIGKKAAKSILQNGSLFVEELEAAAIYEYELNFRKPVNGCRLDRVVIHALLTRACAAGLRRCAPRLQGPLQ